MVETDVAVNGPRYSSGVGMVYLFNLMVGTGALAIPKAFGDAGYVLGLIIIALLGFFSYMSATFVIECMSASNAVLVGRRMQRLKKMAVQAATTDDSTADVSDIEIISGSENAPLVKTSSGDSLPVKPQYFEISRQVELGQMSTLFLNKAGEVFFYACLVLYLFGDLAIYATVVPKSLKHVVCTYLPPGFNRTTRCAQFNETMNDSVPCWDGLHLSRESVYRIFVVVFVLFLGSFVFFTVTKTKYLQVLTSLSRWIAFSLMIGLTFHFLAIGKGAGHPPMFNFNKFGPMFGVSVYSFMNQHSLPALITPFRNKSRIYSLVGLIQGLVFLFYAALALTGAFSFATLNDVYTLNFQGGCTGSSVPTNNKGVQYFLALFPVFTLSTNFPLIGITLRNNIRRLCYPNAETDRSVGEENQAGFLNRAASTPNLRYGQYVSQRSSRLPPFPRMPASGQSSSSPADSVYSSASISSRVEDGYGGDRMLDPADYRTQSAEYPSYEQKYARPSGCPGVPVGVSFAPVQVGWWDKIRWYNERLVIPLVVIIPPTIVALSTEDVEFLVSFTGSYAGAGVQYVMPALLAYGVRRHGPDLVGMPVPRRYASPFKGMVWVWMMLGWAAVTVVIVTVNRIV